MCGAARHSKLDDCFRRRFFRNKSHSGGNDHLGERVSERSSPHGGIDPWVAWYFVFPNSIWALERQKNPYVKSLDVSINRMTDQKRKIQNWSLQLMAKTKKMERLISLLKPHFLSKALIITDSFNPFNSPFGACFAVTPLMNVTPCRMPRTVSILRRHAIWWHNNNNSKRTSHGTLISSFFPSSLSISFGFFSVWQDPSD